MSGFPKHGHPHRSVIDNLLRNATERPAAAVLTNILRLKCEFKGIAVPCLGDLIVHRPDLEASWQNMLGHQFTDRLLPLPKYLLTETCSL